MKTTVRHVHTYFLFPFSIDKEAVMEDHAEIWHRGDNWFRNLDNWVTHHSALEHRAIHEQLGGWRRCSHGRFDLASSAYQDMVFFHPFVRRAFFDSGDHDRHHEALLRCYSINPPADGRLRYEAEDNHGGSATVEISQLQLSLFANGVGILSIAVQATDVTYAQVLWINEMMRKIYPSSDRQIQSGRIPNRMAFVLEQNSGRRVLIEERFEECNLTGFRPRLSNILLELLYFADYKQEEFEPVLDERMVVNTYVALNRDQIPEGFQSSDDYEIAVSRLLYVDQDGEGYRYEPGFTREQMSKNLYRRWQHEGTVYGMTSYSQITVTFVDGATGLDSLRRLLVYRMFASKNGLMAMIALFYRATLLNFAKQSALVSRQLFPIFSGQVIRHRHIQLATRLMADFHYFDNYWFFSEITAKDEEFEHFRLLCDSYRIGPMKEEVGTQIGRLANYIDRLYALRNNDAVNRLAVLSMILGLGALVTGFYGMNIPHLATALGNAGFSRISFAMTVIMTLLSLGLIGYIVAANWIDYRSSLIPNHLRRTVPRKSLRRITKSSA